MANDALNAAAEAMTALANAMGRGGEKSLMKIDFYQGDGTQYPVTWIEEFERAAKANYWSPAHRLELACAYMKDNAQEWLTSLEHEPTHFHNQEHDNLDVVSDYTYEQFETFLVNESIRTALASYLIQESKPTQIQTPTYTTPVKCNIKLQGKPYHAIINSGAAISMISHQVVQELGLKIEAPSTSLIVSAAGSSVRPLRIIKNLLIEIEGTTTPLDVEVMNVTSY